MTFDFEGASPQSLHFFNSKPHIIASIVVSDVTDVLTHDLPLSAAMFDLIEVRCPRGTIMNADLPAPTASAHFDVAMNASMAAQQCLMMAIAASGEDAPGRHLLCGPGGASNMGLHTWAYQTVGGEYGGWFMIEGGLTGGSAGHDRDGYDMGAFMIGRNPAFESADVETFEARYPVLVEKKRPRPGGNGAGKFRAGGACDMAYKPHKVAAWRGVMMGMRESLPLLGFAGGRPGAVVRFSVRRSDGRVEQIGAHESAVVINENETFEFSPGSGGGFGDPIERDAEAVARDVRQGRISLEQAKAIYGVVLDAKGMPDAEQTRLGRQALLDKRIFCARPARQPLSAMEPPLAPALRGKGKPIYPGVENHGGVAYATGSGAALALAPDAWTDGCPFIDEAHESGVIIRSYLDPVGGHLLLTDTAFSTDDFCTVDSRPNHWGNSQPASATQQRRKNANSAVEEGAQ